MMLVLAFVLFTKILSIYADFSNGTGQQDWNFVKVRPGAHMFYWLYYTTADVKHYTQRPLVIWLQGGPGCSSTGSGNFEYFGPIDIHGNKRNNSWVEHVNMLFIDSPVGAGFSYVDVEYRYTTSSSQIARDLVTCMKHFYAKHPEFVSVPLHIFSESYGGKMAPEFGLELYRADTRGEVNANIKSVTVGNPFISLVDTNLAIITFLLQTGRIDLDVHADLSVFALRTVDYLNIGNSTAALMTTYLLFDFIQALLKDVDIYNIDKAYKVGYNYAFNPELTDFMRGPMKQTLNITTGYEWAAQQENAFHNLKEDHSKSSISIIQELLNTTPIKLAFYSGNLDLVCPTPGTVDIINKMEWREKPAYLAAVRKAIKIDGIVQGYEKSDGKLSMFWINRAGHMVQLDNPHVMSYILEKVTNYNEIIDEFNITEW